MIRVRRERDDPFLISHLGRELEHVEDGVERGEEVVFFFFFFFLAITTVVTAAAASGVVVFVVDGGAELVDLAHKVLAGCIDGNEGAGVEAVDEVSQAGEGVFGEGVSRRPPRGGGG